MKFSTVFFINLFLLFGMFSCKDKGAQNDQNIINNVNVSEWNKVTLEYAFKFCDLESNEYGKGKIKPPVVNNNYDTLTVKSHLKEILQERVLLIDTLRKSKLFLKDEITILEFYWENDTFYEIFLANKESFFINYEKNVFKIEKKEWEDPSRFILIDSARCINDLPKGYGYPLSIIDIKSKLSIDKNNKVNYQVEYMYFGERLN